MGDNHQSEEDKAVELWKVKNLIKSLEAARGNGTSMISLILPVRKRDEWKETEIENMNEKTTNEWKEKTLERERGGVIGHLLAQLLSSNYTIQWPL